MRKEIIDSIIQEQQNLIDNLKKSLNTYESTTDLDEESTIDLDDQSHQADIQDMKIEITQKLNQELDDMATIKTLRLREADEIKEGAIIATEDAYYFVGLAFTPFKFNDKKVVGISTQAPVYQNNNGKKKGDTLILGNNEVEIKDIY